MPEDRKGWRVYGTQAHKTAEGETTTSRIYGTVAHDSHGVEAGVSWDDGKFSVELWSNLHIAQDDVPHNRQDT